MHIRKQTSTFFEKDRFYLSIEALAVHPLGVYSQKPITTKKEEGDTRCRPYSLFALMAPLRQRQRKDKRSAVNPHWRPCNGVQKKGNSPFVADCVPKGTPTRPARTVPLAPYLSSTITPYVHSMGAFAWSWYNCSTFIVFFWSNYWVVGK